MTKLSKTVADAEQPTDKERFVWDAEIKGFGLKIFPTGVKSFVFQYRTAEGRTRRYTIGKLSDTLTADQARKRAKQLFADVTNGIDIQGEVQTRREAWTVNELLDAYLASPTFAEKADTTRSVDVGRINRHLRPTLGTLYADKLTRDEVRHARNQVAAGKTAVRAKTGPRGVAKVTGGQGTADKAVLALRAAYTWAIAQGHLKENPAALIKVAQSGRRDTIIEDSTGYANLFKSITALENEKQIRSAAADSIRFIALTGARRGEVIGLIWRWVDLKTGKVELPANAHKTGHKTGRSRIITLPSMACEIIARQPAGELDDYVFRAAKGNGPICLTKPWELVRSAAGLPDGLGLHGLRHSVGSHLAMNGATINEIMEVLGHRQTSTTMRYVHFAEKARTTLAERAASVAMAGLNADSEPAEVIPMAKRGAAA
ncbi:MAG: site-specific integrase [Zoogloeaceae bacterium]|nr:site-specific integrase [Zoogloeaceae bacterium]